MTVSSHLWTIWRHRWRVLIATLVVVGVVYGASSLLLPKKYQATAQLSVSVPNTVAAQQVSQDTVLFFTNTYAQLGRTTPVLDAAAKASGLAIDRLTAQGRISVTASSVVGIITVSATGPDTESATALDRSMADAIINVVVAQQRQANDAQLGPLQSQVASIRQDLLQTAPGSSAATTLQIQLQTLVQQLAQAQLQPNPHLAVVSPALAASAPIAPKTKTTTLLAFITALVLFSELSALSDYLRDRFSVDAFGEDVRRSLHLPVLAEIPSDERRAGDAFQELRTNLLFSQDRGRPPRTVAIVSLEAGTGRTFCAINLAYSMAALRVPVALIDADFRSPAIAGRLSLHPAPGLRDALAGAAIEHCIQHSLPSSFLSVVTAGSATGDPSSGMGRDLGLVFSAFAREELIVVDTPAESGFPDALAIAPLCDATILVIAPRYARRRATLELLARLDQVGAKPLGVVANHVRRPGRWGGRASAGGPHASRRRVPTPMAATTGSS